MQSHRHPAQPTSVVGPPQWQTLPRDPHSIADARSAMNGYPLKGMPGTAGDLSAGRAAVLGTGATGGVAGCALAQTGVGDLDLVDPDSYGPTSFMTQPAAYAHRGRPKALVQAELAQRMNPACRVRAAVSQAQDLLWNDLRKADVFLVAGDSVGLLVWAGQMAAAMRKPLVQAAVHGETGSAIVRSFDLRDANSACPQCGLSERELRAQGSRFGCDLETTSTNDVQATRTMPVICQAAGIYAANEVIKWLGGHRDTAMRGEEFVCSLFAYQTWRTSLPRNPDCRWPHRYWLLEDVPSGAEQTTLGCLAARLGKDMLQPTTQVRSEIPWASFTFCGSCGRAAPVRRFARPGSTVGRCVCGAPLKTVPQGLRSVIPPVDLAVCWGKPLADLGIESAEAVGILRRDQWTYFFTSDCRADPPTQEP